MIYNELSSYLEEFHQIGVRRIHEVTVLLQSELEEARILIMT